MTDASTQNPFAPPRAHVEDQYGAPQQVVTATRASRFLAVLIDCSPGLAIGVVGAIVAMLMLPGMFAGKFDPAAGGMMAFGLFMLLAFAALIGWLIWNIVLVYKYGQTVGKRAMGIRVVRMDGSRVSFARFFFLRWLAVAVASAIVAKIFGAMHMPLLANLTGLVDCLFIFGAAHRCIHDYIADTQVVTAESSMHATLEGSLAR